MRSACRRAEVIYVVRRTPNMALASNIRVGSRLPAHAANMGRIILANLPPESVRRLFESAPMPATKAQTPTTLKQLRAVLEADRAAGLAWSEGNYEAAISSVAAAVLDASGMPVAALNVSAQREAFSGARRRAEIGAVVAAAGETISRRLGWTEAAPRPAVKDVA